MNTPIDSTEPSSTTTPSTTSERAPMKQWSSMIVGLAWSGSSTPPMPVPAEMWQLRPTWAQLPIEAQVSTIVPSPTKAPMLTKLGISTTPLPIKAPRRTMAPGTARNSACAKRAASQPANLGGTLSHHIAPPGPPGIASIGLSRKESRTAFLSHWLTCQPSPFSATRASPASRRRIASSTASRTVSGASPPSSSRRSQASSITCCSASVIRLPLRVFPRATRRGWPRRIDRFQIGVVAAALGAVVEPHRRHAQRLGRGEVAGHVVDEQGALRVDAVAVADRRIALRIGLGHIGHGVDVVQAVEGVGEAEPAEHAPGVPLVGIGEDELAARQPVERRDQRRICGQPGEVDVVHEVEEFARVDAVVAHQPGERRAVREEMPSAPAAPPPDRSEQALDILAHAQVDQREQVAGRRIEAVVEVEDPAFDMGQSGAATLP